MNKKALIITPYFPPVNAADMQRVRMSLPYFAGFGWDAEIVTVYDQQADLPKDELLVAAVPASVKIHQVTAFNKKWTSILGIGSIAFRSMWFYFLKVNGLLKNEKIDLIYFSTTQFPLCILGVYWKKRFNVPYIIDMQDPWYTGHHQEKMQQPFKRKFAYLLHKYLEPPAVKHAAGLISVSPAYIGALKARYPQTGATPSAIITFGAFEPDLQIAAAHKDRFESLLDNTAKNIVYVGRGGNDLHSALMTVFKSMAKGLIDEPDIFKKLKFYFIGTSYAPAGTGVPTILPLAGEYGLAGYVTEITGRIGYYHTLLTIQQADALFIPGSDTPAYTPSKIYPYLLTGKPLLTVFHPQSPALPVLEEYGAPYVYRTDTPGLDKKIYAFLKQAAGTERMVSTYRAEAQKKYAAQNMALQQCHFFNRVAGE